ncbi:MAG: hypothetical protein AUJ52_01530 [Elusimicrobia bacterium CG1_02_63_36]|nr:MAG: hypothetical protein AUJ52_01530 [Elusimicrobia bacterium CG1_02_63_36]PIP85095.1 MAG: hypothetical protein COR54_00675 [Elusimicrobia bacterium CG22_combo_CG10-13_8_21_14_all_63_91]PJA11904.1 MAG: hypothetical protein COX66_18640 [Elusimicrobia bacterium CG_4_10_14_0_2_um_filter_63_34]PJB24810.1 MAG: hypothetical protein CO113_11910 [Elusimicrobia bacterium CG_4_9_14_3_um_filter_62_55]
MWAVAALAAAGCSAWTGAPRRAASEWDTTFQRMHLSRLLSSVEGRYDYHEGTLSGTLKGREFEGWWREDDDTKECGPGEEWTGPLFLTFSEDGKSFAGVYGKCSRGERDRATLDPERRWTGRLASGDPIR